MQGISKVSLYSGSVGSIVPRGLCVFIQIFGQWYSAGNNEAYVWLCLAAEVHLSSPTRFYLQE